MEGPAAKKQKSTIRPVDKELRVQAVLINCVGHRRKTNEDNSCINEFFIPEGQMNANLCVSDERSAKSQFFGVFDGVGSDESGEKASLAAAAFFAEHAQDYFSGFKDESRLDELFAKANQDVLERVSGSSTTAVVLWIAEGAARMSNAGDSRGYLLRQGGMKQLSSEHTRAQEMLAQGLLEAGSKEFAQKSHEIIRFLGEAETHQYWKPSHSPIFPLEHGDLFLLCSDGLTDMVSDDEILYLLQNAGDCHSAAQSLVDKAMENGGKDNITVMLVRILLN